MQKYKVFMAQAVTSGVNPTDYSNLVVTTDTTYLD